MRSCVRALVLALPLLAAACTPDIDLKQGVQVTDVSTGWYDGGIVDGKNKLIPSVTFRIRKTDAGAALRTMALNLVFKREGTEDPFDEIFVQRVEFGPDNQTAPITVRAQAGYTGEPPQSRADMLQNSYFVDMHVQVFGKQTSGQWVDLHGVKVERRLLTQ